jgi:hypothetical protein
VLLLLTAIVNRVNKLSSHLLVRELHVVEALRATGLLPLAYPLLDLLEEVFGRAPLAQEVRLFVLAPNADATLRKGQSQLKSQVVEYLLLKLRIHCSEGF